MSKRKTCVFLVLALCMWSVAPVSADSDVSSLGNNLRQFRETCRFAAGDHDTEEAVDVLWFRTGFCSGVLVTWSFSVTLLRLSTWEESEKYCRRPPEEASFEQLAAIIVKWIDEHPEYWHMKTIDGLVLAYNDLWPCDLEGEEP